MQHRIRNALVTLLLPLLAACAVMVDPEALLVRCEFDPAAGGPDPCQQLGQLCIDGMCRACDADARELCNGRDDDCDGEIDEGHDSDQDGFTWCGGGRLELADCAPTDKAIHPGEGGMAARAPAEACDGKDNDCDAKVDESPDCMKMRDCIETGCPDGQRCDDETGRCIVPREVGSGCTNDSDCKGGFCLRPGAFELPVDLKDNRCATACCSNADCDKESSCVISDSGARACLPKNIAGGGSRAAGERCLRDAECASGFCARVCQARCFSSGACPNEECVLSAVSTSEPRVFWCGDPAGRIASGESCSPLAACRTNYCNAEYECGRACARNADCEMDEFCQFVEEQRSILVPASFVSVCVPRATVRDEEPASIELLCCKTDDCEENQLCAPTAAREMTWHMSCRSM
jgi:hypothetical protein